jgi:outer membrane immunogenic protein
MKKYLFAVSALALFSSAAYAADLVPAPQVAAEMAAVNWSGGYAGANVGWGSGTSDLGIMGITNHYSGLFVGGQVGYNYQLRNGVVFGLQGDLDWSNESGQIMFTPGVPITSQMNWFGSVTGHAGYAFGTLMPYVLAGVAVGNSTGTATPGPGGPSISATATSVGYTVGAGVANMVTDRVSMFGEVRYTDYGSANYTIALGGVGGPTLASTMRDTTLRAGLNFHF